MRKLHDNPADYTAYATWTDFNEHCNALKKIPKNDMSLDQRTALVVYERIRKQPRRLQLDIDTAWRCYLEGAKVSWRTHSRRPTRSASPPGADFIDNALNGEAGCVVPQPSASAGRSAPLVSQPHRSSPPGDASIDIDTAPHADEKSIASATTVSAKPPPASREWILYLIDEYNNVNKEKITMIPSVAAPVAVRLHPDPVVVHPTTSSRSTLPLDPALVSPPLDTPSLSAPATTTLPSTLPTTSSRSAPLSVPHVGPHAETHTEPQGEPPITAPTVPTAPPTIPAPATATLEATSSITASPIAALSPSPVYTSTSASLPADPVIVMPLPPTTASPSSPAPTASRSAPPMSSSPLVPPTVTTAPVPSANSLANTSLSSPGTASFSAWPSSLPVLTPPTTPRRIMSSDEGELIHPSDMSAVSNAAEMSGQFAFLVELADSAVESEAGSLAELSDDEARSTGETSERAAPPAPAAPALTSAKRKSSEDIGASSKRSKEYLQPTQAMQTDVLANISSIKPNSLAAAVPATTSPFPPVSASPVTASVHTESSDRAPPFTPSPLVNLQLADATNVVELDLPLHLHLAYSYLSALFKPDLWLPWLSSTLPESSPPELLCAVQSLWWSLQSETMPSNEIVGGKAKTNPKKLVLQHHRQHWETLRKSSKEEACWFRRVTLALTNLRSLGPRASSLEDKFRRFYESRWSLIGRATGSDELELLAILFLNMVGPHAAALPAESSTDVFQAHAMQWISAHQPQRADDYAQFEVPGLALIPPRRMPELLTHIQRLLNDIRTVRSLPRFSTVHL